MGFPRVAARSASSKILGGLWLAYLPLLFLPNLGMERPTRLGTLQMSDYLMPGYLLLVLPAALRNKGPRSLGQLVAVMGAFALWAAVSTLSIPLRYPYGSDSDGPMLFGLAKLAKFLLYTAAGLLTAKAYRPSRDLQFHWALLAANTVMGAALCLEYLSVRLGGILTYQANNAVSVEMALLMVYLLGRYIEGYGSTSWRRAVLLAGIPTMVGFLLSEGRGGWVAFAAGLGYYLMRRGLLRRSTLRAALAIAVGLTMGYMWLPGFRQVVDRTLHPPAQYVQAYPQAVAGGVDVGARPYTWASEARKLVDSPLLGTGFYHRGGFTRLWITGSHNFFLQMFLETGLVGGALMLAFFALLWYRARGVKALKAALVAAFVGGLGGEYFYGGLPLLALLLVYAPVGGIGVGRLTKLRRESVTATQPLTLGR